MTGRCAGARHDRGQSTVELALALPVVALLLLVVLQVGLIGRDTVVVTHAAREAARAAAVDPAPEAARRAATSSGGLEADAVTVTVRRHRGPAGRVVNVTVTYRLEGSVPLVGRWITPRAIRASATMRDETS